MLIDIIMNILLIYNFFMNKCIYYLGVLLFKYNFLSVFLYEYIMYTIKTLLIRKYYCLISNSDNVIVSIICIKLNI